MSTAIRDLRDWLSAVEEAGELHRVKEQVDWDEEMAAITYMVGKMPKSPALLFENIKGYSPDHRVLLNMLGSSSDRIALALRLPTGLSITELIQLTRERIGRRIPPRIVSAPEALVNENVIVGDKVDVREFPAPKMWPLDGGRYIGTADVVITKDPDNGYINLGTYRQMVYNAREVGFYTSPGKDARLHREKWWARGEPCEVAAVYGVDPLLFIVGSQGFPKTVSEYEYAGGIQGEPIDVVKGEVTDLLIPARAEIVIEGISRPDLARPEGPFGEFTGYYGRPEGETPVIEVKCVHYRNKPILTSSLMAEFPACDQALFFGIARSARIWNDLDTLGITGIRGVYAHPAAASGFGMVVVSLQQQYAGHAQQVLALTAQCPGGAYYTKWIIAVDEDVDPTDINQVLWAMATRCNPTEDIDILRSTWSTWLDPTQNPPDERPYGSKALINACKEHKYISVFSRRSAISEAMYGRVVSRWTELGLPGQPPPVTTFETLPSRTVAPESVKDE